MPQLLFILSLLIFSVPVKAATAEAVSSVCVVLLDNELSEKKLHSEFVNVQTPGNVNLTDPFLKIFSERGNSHVKFMDPDKGIQAVLEKSIFPAFDLVVFRSEVLPALESTVDILVNMDEFEDFLNKADALEGAYKGVKALAPFRVNLTSDDVTFKLNNALNYLYTRYERQGPERRNNILKYRMEDIQTADRTTHFLFMYNEEVVAHIQAQVSTDPSVPLNLETHFDTSNIIKRQPGELVIEVGRLEITKPMHLSEKAQGMLQAAGGREVMISRVLQKLTSWLTSDVAAQRVVFQMNSKVLKSFERAISPVTLKKKHLISQTPPASDEWIIECDYETLREIESVSFKRVIYYALSNAFSYSNFMRSKGVKFSDILWSLFFWPNEYEALKNIEMIQNEKDLWHELFQNERVNFLMNPALISKKQNVDENRTSGRNGVPVITLDQKRMINMLMEFNGGLWFPTKTP